MIFVDASVPRSVADEIKKVRPGARWMGDLSPSTLRIQRGYGRQGWLVVTHDKKIRTRPGERRAIKEHNVGCFILAYKQDLKKREIAELVLSALQDMEELFERTPRPFIYTISKDGEFRQYSI